MSVNEKPRRRRWPAPVIFILVVVAIVILSLRLVPKAPIVIGGYPQAVSAVAFTPDGRRIVTASFDKKLRIYDARTGVLQMILTGASVPLYCVAVSPDSKLIASHDGSDIALWDSHTGAKICNMKSHVDEIYSIAFSPDGKLLASGGNDKLAVIWDVSSGRPLHKLWNQKFPVGPVRFTPDSKRLATGDMQFIHVWDIATGKETRRMSSAPVQWILFAKDESTFISGGVYSGIEIWNARTSKRRHTIQQLINAIALRPGNHSLISAEPDALREYGLKTGAMIRTIAGKDVRTRWPGWILLFFPSLQEPPIPTITSLAIAPDGGAVAACCVDRTVRIWNIR